MKTNKENSRRCKRIENVLLAYGSRGSDEETVIDLLTDLRHFCKREKLDFKHLDKLAYSHFIEEDGANEEKAYLHTHPCEGCGKPVECTLSRKECSDWRYACQDSLPCQNALL